MYTHARPYAPTHPHPHTHPHTYPHTHTHIHTRAPIGTHTCTHAHPSTNTHTHLHCCACMQEAERLWKKWFDSLKDGCLHGPNCQAKQRGQACYLGSRVYFKHMVHGGLADQAGSHSSACRGQREHMVHFHSSACRGQRERMVHFHSSACRGQREHMVHGGWAGRWATAHTLGRPRAQRLQAMRRCACWSICMPLLGRGACRAVMPPHPRPMGGWLTRLVLSSTLGAV